jgi:hypothetical protein
MRTQSGVTHSLARDSKRYPRTEIVAHVGLVGVASAAFALFALFTEPVFSGGGESLAVAHAATAFKPGKSGQDRQSDRRRGGSAASAQLAPHAPAPALNASTVTAGSATETESKRVPLFFGFLVFDWDPDAPGGVPGFGPMPH